MRFLPLALVIAATSLTACSGTSIGTGGDGGTSGTSGTPSTSSDPEGTVTSGGSSTLPPSTTSDTQYDYLFEAPASTVLTPDTLKGLWAGTMYNTEDDLRIKIGSSTITIAVRCGTGHGGYGTPTTVGLVTTAVVSATSIRLVESKSAGTTYCKINVTPRTFTRGTTGENAFDVTGTTLYFSSYPLFTADGVSSSGPNSSLTKLSD